jgi:hypothetical protein
MTDETQGETQAATTETAKKPGRKGFGINFKVSAKGAVSVYGLGRFPVTLYREQWVRLLERTDDLKAFMEEHADELTKKGDAPAGGDAQAAGGEAQPAAAGGAEAAPPASAPAATTIEEAGAPAGDDDPDTPPDDYDGLS